MSNQNQDFYQTDLIVRYLSNQMSEPEKSAFQSRLLFDSELRKEVSELRTLRKAHAAAAISSKPAPNALRSPWGWAAAAVTVFAVVAILYTQFDTTNTKTLPTPVVPATQPTVAPAVTPVANTQSDEPVASVPSDAAKASPAAAKLPKATAKAVSANTDKTETATAEGNTTAEPIAYNEADFKENDYLEEWRIGRTRKSVVLIPPDQNFKFMSVNGRINFVLKGIFNGDKKLFIDVYSNNQEDFQAGKVLLSDEVVVEENGNFIFSRGITLKPGLYYYVLGHTDEPVVVGKIEVR